MKAVYLPDIIDLKSKMIIKIKDINNNITFELLIESNILINDLHKCIRKVHNQYLGNNGIDVIRINGSLHILLYFVSLDKYVEINYGNKPLNFIIDEYNHNQWRKETFNFLSFEHFNSTEDYAKELYTGYDCSFVEMGKDGWYEIYELCNVPNEKAREWKIEYLEKKVDNKQQTD